MPDFGACRGVLLDIEGTVSPIRFVYDEMFPYARREIPGYVQAHWGDPSFSGTVDAIADDVGLESSKEWMESEQRAGAQAVIDVAIGMMDADKKATGLKRLQGEVWQAGFESGELVAQLFPDVFPALQRWKEQGLDVRIYSSGSVKAQLLFFRYTEVGDLLSLLGGHYDTTTGPKKEAASYTAIAGQFELEPPQVLFCSDLVDELNAARDAGMKTLLCMRPGNAEVADDCGHQRAESFELVMT
jgi:enolase-phosphatase E1